MSAPLALDTESDILQDAAAAEASCGEAASRWWRQREAGCCQWDAGSRLACFCCFVSQMLCEWTCRNCISRLSDHRWILLSGARRRAGRVLM